MNRLLVFVVPLFLACAHTQVPTVNARVGSNSARLAVTNPDRSGGRVHFMTGPHGRRRAAEVMRGFCRGSHRVTQERMLWVPAVGWSFDGPVAMSIPTTSDIIDPLFDRELTFSCEGAPDQPTL